MSDLVIKPSPGDTGAMALYYKGELLPFQLSTQIISNADGCKIVAEFSAVPAAGVEIQGQGKQETPGYKTMKG